MVIDTDFTQPSNGTTTYSDYQDVTPTQGILDLRPEPPKEYFSFILGSNSEKKQKKEIRRDMRKFSKRAHDRW